MTARLEDFKPDSLVWGLVGREVVRIFTSQMMGEAAQVVYREGQGTIDSQILFRDKEAELEIDFVGRKRRLRAKANSTGCPERTTTRSSRAHA